MREEKQAGRLVWRSVAAGRWYTAAAAATSVVGGLLAFAMPAALAAAVDSAVDGAVRGGDATGAVLVLALLLCGLVVTEVGGQYAATLGAAAITLSLRRRLLAHLVRAGVAASARMHTGDAVSRITANAGEVAGGLGAMTAVLALSMAAVGGVVGLAALNPWTLLVVAAAVAAGWVVARRFVVDTTTLMTGYMTAPTGPARVLVLDDAMSSLDTVTEVHVSRAVTEGRAGRTTVVVGYRAGTAARCDRVAWLHRGRIRRVAPHHELWSDPEYRALFTATTGPTS